MAAKWQPEDLAYLAANYRSLGPEACANYIGKTIAAIRLRAATIGVAKKNNLADYNRINLAAVCASSNTLSDVLIKLNIKSAGGNFQTLRNRITEYGIDVSHFDPNAAKSARLRNKGELPYDTVFCCNSTAKRGSVKRWLRKLGRQFVCELDGCGQGEEWRGKKISLILDHINGVSDDNRMENLRLVCPNCNATLDTHAGKNTARARKNRLKLMV